MNEMHVDLDAVFAPRRIAVVGASADMSKFGSRLVGNLRRYGFPGEVHPISRSVEAIGDYRTVPSLGELPASPDLVLVSVPVQHVASIVDDAVKVGAKAAVIYTAGFAESGEAGSALQDDIRARAKRGGLRLVGPNCLGVRNFHYTMNATPMQVETPPSGPIAFISQSGAFGNAAFAALRAARIGLSKLASIGNMADIDHAAIFRYLAEDEDTKVIAAFVEGVRNIDDFLDVIRDVSPRKPVVVLKGGRSKSGQAAALSHTSSMAGDGRVWDALLKEAGANVVEGSEELFDVAACFARVGANVPKSRRTAILTLAGGPAVVAADHCDLNGLELPVLEGDLEPAIRDIVPPFASLRNPVDLTGQTLPANFGRAIEQVARLDQVDAMLAIAIGLDIPEYCAGVIAALKIKPVVACVVAPRTEQAFVEAGVPNYPSVERAVRALRHLAERGERLASDVPPAASAGSSGDPLPPGVLTERQSKAWLKGFGLPVTEEEETGDAEQAVRIAGRIGYPVALKVSSEHVAHKSDRGGVLLNIANEADLHAAFATLKARFPDAAVLVQQMVPSGTELIVGGQRNAATGAVVMIGIGGVYAEVLDDVTFCRAPASPAAVARAISRLRNQRVLDGFRGAAPVDRDTVADIGAILSRIMHQRPEIGEVDLNPVISHPGGTVIVDALIRVDGKAGE